MGYHCCQLRYTILVYVCVCMMSNFILAKELILYVDCKNEVDLDQFWLRPSLSFCSSAMRCSMGWGTTCWCPTESSTSSKSSKDHTFETAVFSNVWSLSSFKTKEFIVSPSPDPWCTFLPNSTGIPDNFWMKAWRCQKNTIDNKRSSAMNQKIHWSSRFAKETVVFFKLNFT